MSDSNTKQFLEQVIVDSPMKVRKQCIKDQSDVEILLLQQTFKNTRLSDLIFDKSKSHVKDVYHKLTKQDYCILVEEINILKQIIAQKDRQIQKIKIDNSESSLYKQIEFLNNNNHNLFKTIKNFQKQMRVLSKQISNKTQNQNKLIKQIQYLNVQIYQSNKLIRKLVRSQKKVLQNQQQQINKINVIKSQFQKQNKLLRSQIKSIQKGNINDCSQRTNRSKQSQSYSDLQLSTQYTDNKDIEIMKKQIYKLKSKVKYLGKKENSFYLQNDS